MKNETGECRTPLMVRLKTGAVWRRFAAGAAGLLLGMLACMAGDPTLFVSPSGTHVPPFDTWETAAMNIQDAVDAASPGALILVTNGVYASGGRPEWDGALTNRVLVDKAVTLRSVNGPEVTVICGDKDPVDAAGIGSSAIRCVSLSEGAVLDGFTLTNGASGRYDWYQSGSAVCGSGLVTNCIIAGNIAGCDMSVVYDCEVINSRITGNHAFERWGCIASECSLRGCTVSENVYDGTGSYMLYDVTAHGCLVSSNTAAGYGLAAWSDFYNCLFMRNQGSAECLGDRCGFYGCSVLDNRFEGAAVRYSSTVVDSIVWGNTNTLDGIEANHSDSSFSFSCSRPLPSGEGNLDTDPALAGGGDYHLQPWSPCIGRGVVEDWMNGATDLDGDPRLSGTQVDIGADQLGDGGASGVLQVEIIPSATNAVVGSGLVFEARVNGHASVLMWNLGDGGMRTNVSPMRYSFGSAGVFTVRATVSNQTHAAEAEVEVRVLPGDYTIYVSRAGSHVFPFETWETAATNLQDAVDAAPWGALVLVGDGVYSAGGRIAAGQGIASRLCVEKPLVVRSVNGPLTTVIGGASDPETGGPGAAAVRCVHLGSESVLDGFTLKQGCANDSGPAVDRQGAAVFCTGSQSVTNCVICENIASPGGSMIQNGRFLGCVIVSNSLSGDGGSLLARTVSEDCRVVGNVVSGASRLGWMSRFEGGLVVSNVVTGGDTDECSLLADAECLRTVIDGNVIVGRWTFAMTRTVFRNAVIRGNTLSDESSSAWYRSGLSGCVLEACTVVGNVAFEDACIGRRCQVSNSIVSGNWDFQTGSESNWMAEAAFDHSCTRPLPPGEGNIDADPARLNDVDFHLQPWSPCIGAGRVQDWMLEALDMDGEARLSGGRVDIGADQFGGGDYSGTMQLEIIPCATNVVLGNALAFSVRVGGSASALMWDLGDGGMETNVSPLLHSFSAAGTFTVRAIVTNQTHVATAEVVVRVFPGDFTVHVSSSGSSVPPFETWETAATNLQDAVDAAPWGALVLVGDGVYATGGRVAAGQGILSRLCVEKPLIVRSVHGPMATVIEGASDPETGGPGIHAVRCAHLGAGAVLEGFTLKNGCADNGGAAADNRGAALFCAGLESVNHCVIQGNTAGAGGSVVAGGRLTDCRVISNNLVGDGGSLLEGLVCSNVMVTTNAVSGASTLMRQCQGLQVRILGNSVRGTGTDALIGCQLRNTLVCGNVLSGGNSGFAASLLSACVVIANRSSGFCIGEGNRVDNSIIFYNTNTLSGIEENCAPSLDPQYSCTRPLPGNGSACIEAEPCLASFDDPHLLPWSPCVGVGGFMDWMTDATDMDGEPRASLDRVDIGIVDMGMDQCNDASLIGALSAQIILSPSRILAGTSVRCRAEIHGRASGCVWEIGSDEPVFNVDSIERVFEETGRHVIRLTVTNLTDSVVVETMVDVVDPGYVTYVSPSGAHVYPFDSWASAATNLQDAVDAAPAGTTVRVNDGAYDSGGRMPTGQILPSRLCVEKPLTVCSVNGPGATRIRGAFASTNSPLGAGAMRCVFLGDGAVLDGFTLTNGAVLGSADESQAPNNAGAAVYGTSGSVVKRCVADGNVAGGFMGSIITVGACHQSSIVRNRSAGGGVVVSGPFFNSVISCNGGPFDSVAGPAELNGCTVLANAFKSACWNGSIERNCILFYNTNLTRQSEDDYSGSNEYSIESCYMPQCPCCGEWKPQVQDPRIAGLLEPHLLPDSPCIGKGAGPVDGESLDDWKARFGIEDVDGELRATELPDGTVRVDAGADQFHGEALDGPLTVAIAPSADRVLPGQPLSFRAGITGKVVGFEWDFGAAGRTTNALIMPACFVTPGIHAVRLTASNLTSTVTAVAEVVVVSEGVGYVSPSGRHISPFDTWETAATNIQDAVDAVPVGGTVWVANGIYDTGGRELDGLMNRVCIDKAVLVRSVNGHAATVIRGSMDATENGLGSGAVRCVRLGAGAVLSGFTLTGGATRADVGEDGAGACGAAVFAGTAAATVRNCRIAGNTSGSGSVLQGGAYWNCLVISNTSLSGDVGVDVDCVHCTLSANASYPWTINGGRFLNCIAFLNSAWIDLNAYSPTRTRVDHSDVVCYEPVGGSLAEDPLFLDSGSGNFHLQSISPCVDAGGFVAGLDEDVDLDGHARRIGPGVDMGAFESGDFIRIVTQPASVLAGTGWEARIRVEVESSLPVAYQWFRGMSYASCLPVPDATNATLVLPCVQTAQQGNYWVMASNNTGAILSSMACLTVEQTNALHVNSCSLPASGGFTEADISVITLRMSKYLVPAATASLFSVGADGILDTADDVSLPVEVTAQWNGSISVVIPGGSLGPGWYKFVLDDTVTDRLGITMGAPHVVRFLVARPNLVPSGLSMSARGTNSFQPGRTVTVSYVLSNDGNCPASSAWVDSLVLSQNDQFGDADDVPVAIIRHPAGLRDGASVTNIVTLELPYGVTGDYRFLVRADARNAIRERVELDNDCAMSAPFVIVPMDDEAMGLSLLINADFGGAASRRAGPAALGLLPEDRWNSVTNLDGEYVELRLSSERTICGEVAVDAQGAGSWNRLADPMLDSFMCTGSRPLTVTLSNLLAGSYTLYVYGTAEQCEVWMGDVSHGIQTMQTEPPPLEDPATNTPPWILGVHHVRFDNLRVQWPVQTIRVVLSGGACKISGLQLIVHGREIVPDLRIVGVMVPSDHPIQSGEQLTFSYTGINDGFVPLPKIGWQDRVVFSTNAVLGDADDIEMALVDNSRALEVGECYTNFVTVRLPDGISGSGRFFITADARNRIGIGDPESNATGGGGFPFEVSLAPYPDLAVENLHATGVTEAGSCLHMVWTLLNTGNGPVRNAGVQRLLVTSASGMVLDPVFVDLPLLGTNASVVQEAFFVPPAPGRYQVEVLADATNSVFEYNSGGHEAARENNRLAVSVDVGVDQTGPGMFFISLGNQWWTNTPVAGADAQLMVMGVDVSGVSNIQVALDGGAFDAMTPTGSNFVSLVPVETLADGLHEIILRGVDGLGNVSFETNEFRVLLAPPATAPIIVSPGNGMMFTRNPVIVQGVFEGCGLDVVVYVGSTTGAVAVLGTNGSFSTTINLPEGTNWICAAARNRAGEGVRGRVSKVLMDPNAPLPPTVLVARAMEGGAIKLLWKHKRLPNHVGYILYRSETEFDKQHPGSRINSEPLSEAAFVDYPPSDGTWYYRVCAITRSQLTSAWSPVASALSDRVIPTASIIYSTTGYRSGDRFGPGIVTVDVTLSEEVPATPFLSMVRTNGMPVPVQLEQRSTLSYRGQFEITPAMGTCELFANFSCRDAAGNRCTEVASGSMIVVDAEGPPLQSIETTPPGPWRNDPASPLQVTVTLRFDINDLPARPPSLSGLLESSPESPVQIPVSPVESNVWTGQFTLPATAGVTPELFRFHYMGVDDLSNSCPVIRGISAVQVYQGNLPPLSAPGGLTATSGPAGRVCLLWRAVDCASGYAVYQAIPGGQELQPVARVPALEWNEVAPDGAHAFAVAAVREANGQVCTGAVSQAVTVICDSTPPPAPVGLRFSSRSSQVQLEWDAVDSAESISYRVYRNTTPMTSMAGLSPLLAQISSTMAVDEHPLQGSAFYGVTAMDAAGNESSLSTVLFTNLALLPVEDLTVTRFASALPVLTWTHSGMFGIESFQIETLDLQGNLLHSDPVPPTMTNWVDVGFDGSNRVYRVTATGSDSGRPVSSAPRSVLLPVVNVTAGFTNIVFRHAINPLSWQVDNQSGTDLPDVTMRVSWNGTEYESGCLSISAGQTSNLVVTVPGMVSAADQVSVTNRLCIQGGDGGVAVLIQTNDVLVWNDTLPVSLRASGFTRGGSGQCVFEIVNAGQETLEIVCGGSPQTDVRFTLEHLEGMVYSVAWLSQTTGDHIVTMADGRSIIRLEPGQRFESAPVTIPAPAALPDEVVLRASVLAIRSGTGTGHEICMPGPQGETRVLLRETLYQAAVDSVVPLVVSGTAPVHIAGHVLWRSDVTQGTNALVKVVLACRGFERELAVRANAAGQWSLDFSPLPTESGDYMVSALHPDMTERPVQGRFSVRRVWLYPLEETVFLARGEDRKLLLSAWAMPGTALTGARLECHAQDQPGGTLPAGLRVVPGDPMTVREDSVQDFNVILHGSEETPDAVMLNLRLVSDTPAPCDWGMFSVNCAFLTPEGRTNAFGGRVAAPELVFEPAYVETGVMPGSFAVGEICIRNAGMAAARNVRVTLTATNGEPVPGWVLLNTATNAMPLNTGEQRDISLTFAPGIGVVFATNQLFEFVLHVNGDNFPEQTAPVLVHVDSRGRGGIGIHVSDLFTGTLDTNGLRIAGVDGAIVELTRQDSESEFQTNGTTGSLGEVVFDDLPAGRYGVRVNAAGHDPLRASLDILPGMTGARELFVEMPLVRVDWSVVSVPLEDRYEWNAKMTYKTDVPAPVVVLDPVIISLPEMTPGQAVLGELTLANHGLVRAKNITLPVFKVNRTLKFEFLAPVPATLESKQVLRLPYRITCLDENGGDDDGGGCISFPEMVVSGGYGYNCMGGSEGTGGVEVWITRRYCNPIGRTTPGGQPPNRRFPVDRTGGGNKREIPSGTGSGNPLRIIYETKFGLDTLYKWLSESSPSLCPPPQIKPPPKPDDDPESKESCIADWQIEPSTHPTASMNSEAEDVLNCPVGKMVQVDVVVTTQNGVKLYVDKNKCSEHTDESEWNWERTATLWVVKDLETGKTLTSGLGQSARYTPDKPGDYALMFVAEFEAQNPDYLLSPPIHSEFMIHAFSTDLDTDTDNTGVVDCNEDEENAEDVPPGKVMLVNDGDADKDGIPDLADFDSDGGRGFGQLTPLMLKVDGNVDLSSVGFRFHYEAADPLDLFLGGNLPETGSIRLWKSNDPYSRDPESDFIVPDEEYSAGDLGFAGMEATLFVEAVSPSVAAGDIRVVLEIDPNGKDKFVETDAVRMTALSVALAVDGNRDGIVDFSDPADRYLRFWLNDDQDEESYSVKFTDNDPETMPPSMPDSHDQLIKTTRDLEDFTRLHVRYFGPFDGLFRVGVRWVPESGNPCIRLFDACEEDGGWKYIRNQITADQQIEWPFNMALVNGKTKNPDSAAIETIVMPRLAGPGFDVDVLKNRWLWRQKVGGEHRRYLIFEGVEEGKGTLVPVVYENNDDRLKCKTLANGRDIRLEISNIERFYDRVHSTPTRTSFTPAIYLPSSVLDWNSSSVYSKPYLSIWTNCEFLPELPPYEGYPHNIPVPVVDQSKLGFEVNYDEMPSKFEFEPANDEDPTKCIVFVHGICMTIPELKCYTESMYKRLWWEGYRGRLVVFRWSTPLSFITEGNFQIFNNGEFRSWNCGASLKQYIERVKTTMPRASISIVGHSLGNACVGSALKQGMVVDNYIMMEPAISQECYFPEYISGNVDLLANSYENYLIQAEKDNPTPENASQMGYRGYLDGINKNVNKCWALYFDPVDFWLISGKFRASLLKCNWVSSQIQNKYCGETDSSHYASYLLNGITNYIWTGIILQRTNSAQNLSRRKVFDITEHLAYISRSRTRPIGVGFAPLTPNFNQDTAISLTAYGFEDKRYDHSGQFLRPIQWMYATHNGSEFEKRLPSLYRQLLITMKYDETTINTK
jgi:PKD repeat protein